MPHANAEARTGRAHAIGNVPEKAQAVVERSAVAAWPAARAQQFVAEIAMAVLQVDELEAEVGREPRGGDEVFAQPVELIVGQHAHAAGEPVVEERMLVGDERVRRMVEPMASRIVPSG